MSYSGWNDTNLWRHIQEKTFEDRRCETYLASFLGDVELLLRSSNTSPLDFTLHDAQHSFRVAQRMTELLDDHSIKHLSIYELSLLLAAAYLHDIGMNPARKIVLEIRSFLLNPSQSSLSEMERGRLQYWLDNFDPGTQAPILASRPEPERLKRAEYLTAYFCRERHNEWSGFYVQDTLSSIPNQPYHLWIDDLILLCKSHHYGLERLQGDDFNARFVSSDKELVNLRFLAALLRVSDVLDVDPERTPSVIFQQRSIHSDSLIYWNKDKHIQINLERGRHDVFISARTPNAWIHKAVLETCDDIDRELSVCAELDRTGLFTKNFFSLDLEHYRWKWPIRSTREVRAASDAFSFIDGAFKPNSQRLIQLLAGTRLYGNRLASIRELLQNAVDAVKEQILREALEGRVQVSRTSIQARGQFHEVSISVARESDRIKITCEDTGTGMSRNVIQSNLLVSGAKPRASILSLERTCREQGLDFERSGEFGIGVLSYFMIADVVLIETKVASLEIGTDTQSWRFELGGLGDFGELRPIAKRSAGTKVVLILKEEFCTDDWEVAIVDFIQSVLIKTPCNFRLVSDHSNIATGPGWVKTLDLIKTSLIDPRANQIPQIGRYIERHSAKKTEAIKLSSKRRREVRDRMSVATLVSEPTYREMPSVGEIRVHIICFMINGEASLLFMDADHRNVQPGADGQILFPSQRQYRLSWRGFRIDGDDDDPERRRRRRTSYANAYVEVNLISSAQVSIDRSSIEIDQNIKLDREVVAAYNDALEKFYVAHALSDYHVFSPSWCLSRRANGHKPSPFWLLDTAVDSLPQGKIFRQIAFPALARQTPMSDSETELVKGRRHRVGAEDVVYAIKSGSEVAIPLYHVQPTKLIVAEIPFATAFLLYENADQWIPGPITLVDMPPEWKNMLCVTFANNVYNRDHALIKIADNDSIEIFTTKASGLEVNEEIELAASCAPFAASFIIKYAKRDVEFWNMIRDNFKTPWDKIWTLCNIGESPVVIWNDQYGLVCNSIMKDRCDLYRIYVGRYESKWRHLPRPGEDWFC